MNSKTHRKNLKHIRTFRSKCLDLYQRCEYINQDRKFHFYLVPREKVTKHCQAPGHHITHVM